MFVRDLKITECTIGVVHIFKKNQSEQSIRRKQHFRLDTFEPSAYSILVDTPKGETLLTRNTICVNYYLHAFVGRYGYRSSSSSVVFNSLVVVESL